MTRLTPITVLLTLGMLFLAGCDDDDDVTAPEGPPSLQQITDATEAFQDPQAARDAGYVSTEECVAHPTEGAMGVHFANPQLLGLTDPVNGRVHGTDPEIDFLEPEILVYEPQSDGSLELVALEFLVFADAWDANNEGAPSYEDHEFHYMEDDPSTEADEAHGFTPHYDRHMWLFKNNPSGTFADWNPDVTCEHYSAEG